MINHLSPRCRPVVKWWMLWIGCSIWTAPLSGLAQIPSNAPTLSMPSIFGNHMVLQRDLPLPVWGRASPGAVVTVSFRGQTQTGTADADGAWRVKLNPGDAGGPFDLTATAGTNTLTCRDVLVGEVWICSGQSNMQMPLSGATNGAAEVAQANWPQIRLFTVAQTVTNHPAPDVRGAWSVCASNTAGGFSAVGYFFGRDIHGALNVPVGLINASVGGTPAEAWTPREALENNPILKPALGWYFETTNEYFAAKQTADKAMAEWTSEHRLKDPGNAGAKAGWADPQAELAAWGTIRLPVMLMHSEPSLYMQGAFWFRRDVDIPPAWAGHPLTLTLGPIADFDATYFNGKPVGATDADKPETAKVERRYSVAADSVKSGRAVIAVRLFCTYGEGGFGASNQMALARADDPQAQPIPLTGEWRYRVEYGAPSKTAPHGPVDPRSTASPTKLFNGMIAPLIPYGIRGVIWYQGEANGGNGDLYRALFPALIQSWRKAWGQPPPPKPSAPGYDFPFLYVQLANWLHRQEVPADCPWSELREAQLKTLAVTNTAMAVTIDIGDALSIHPRNKQEVGRRLALAAQAIAYGRHLEYSGPIYRDMTIEKGKVRVRFDHAGRLRARGGGELTGFTVAGEDRRFVPAHAKLHGDTVLVWSDEVAAPMAVRYAWHYNPECNLVNAEDLPASPFRTDDWPVLSTGVP